MGNIRLYGSTSGYTELAPPTVAPDGVLSLPSGTGTIAKTTDQGLVLINTTTFSAAASVSIDSVFTSTYDNYRLIINSTLNSGDQNFSMRARVAGVDNTGANEYNTTQIFATDGAGPSRTHSNTSSWILGKVGNLSSNVTIDILSPALSSRTDLIGFSYNKNSSDMRIDTLGCSRLTAAAQDGFTLFPASGTITGTFRVYGYKNS